MTEFERNEEIAEIICRDFRWSGRQFRLGEFVALLDGEVAAVADDPDAAISALRSLDPDPSRGIVFPVHPPVVDVIR